MLSITEMFLDPHYQSRSTVKRLAEEAGFRLQSLQGGLVVVHGELLETGGDSLVSYTYTGTL